MRTICTAAGLAAVLLLLGAVQAWAASPAPAPPDSGLAPVSDSELAGMSGGEATTPQSMAMTLTSQSATNGNNSVTAGGNVDSGDVNLGQNAFNGFAGIGNFVINTGHNNNLLGSLSVAINMASSAVAGNQVQ